MVVNESLLLSEVASSVSNGSVGFYVNNILFLLGGLGGATLLYFVIVIYYQYKHLKAEEETLELLRLETTLLEEQYKMVVELHKILILEQRRVDDGKDKVGNGPS